VDRFLVRCHVVCRTHQYRILEETGFTSLACDGQVPVRSVSEVHDLLSLKEESPRPCINPVCEKRRDRSPHQEQHRRRGHCGPRFPCEEKRDPEVDEKQYEQRLEGLRERVVDLPESERKNQETAKEIQETLLGLVNEKNEKANAYEKTFKRRVDAKINRKELRQGKKEMKAKYGTTEADLKTATKHKEQYNKGDYKQILQGIRKSHKTEEDIRNEIFAIIKRAFNKNITLHQGSDIDKDASLFLLKVAGFFRDNGKKLELKDIIKEVPQGESGEKGLSIDT